MVKSGHGTEQRDIYLVAKVFMTNLVPSSDSRRLTTTYTVIMFAKSQYKHLYF